jgi:hypothetical protein
MELYIDAVFKTRLLLSEYALPQHATNRPAQTGEKHLPTVGCDITLRYPGTHNAKWQGLVGKIAAYRHFVARR